MNREILRFPFYLIVHPFNAYWELKYERNQRTSLWISFAILAALSFTMILQAQYAGFVVNYNDPRELNSFMEIVYVVVPVLVFSIANWSLTTLMDGEGKFVEIFISTCFALTPMILINFPLIWISNFMSLDEAAFYYFFTGVAALWTLYLLFVGNMTVQQFTPSKTIMTLFFTLVAMGFMAFLGLLFFSLIQQIAGFVITIYQEIVMRS